MVNQSDFLNRVRIWELCFELVVEVEVFLGDLTLLEVLDNFDVGEERGTIAVYDRHVHFIRILPRI